MRSVLSKIKTINITSYVSKETISYIIFQNAGKTTFHSGSYGPRQVGKSTLLRSVNLLEKPTAGSVLFRGEDLTQMKKKELCVHREQMGMVFQQFNLFPHLSVLDNITIAPVLRKRMGKDEAHQTALQLLERWGWPTRPTPCRAASRVARSSAWPLPARCA